MQTLSEFAFQIQIDPIFYKLFIGLFMEIVSLIFVCSIIVFAGNVKSMFFERKILIRTGIGAYSF